MHELAPLIYDLAVMLGLASVVVILFQRIHQPVVLGYLVAGMIIGPYTPPYALIKDVSNIQTLSELGVIFLMFSLGLEFSFHKLTRVGFSASVTGLIEVLLMICIGFATGYLLGWTYYDSLFLGAALSVSSTTIIIKAIDELGLKTKRFAELIFGVLIVEDLLAILLLVALSTIVLTKNVFSRDMLVACVQLVLVVGGWFLFGYFLVPPLFRKIADYISQETLTIISVALCLTLVCIAANYHYSAALGAFIMGSILAETILVKRIEDLIRPITHIFAAVFFISVGMLINPAVIMEHWGVVLLLSFITITGKLLTTSMAALLTGQSVNTSVRVGFSMAQVGEFSFIIAALGLSLEVTSNTLYPLIVAVSGITTFTTPYLIRLSAPVGQALEKSLPARTRHLLTNYAELIYRPSGNTGMSLLRAMLIRLLVNGIIVAIIFVLNYRFIYPRMLILDIEIWIINILSLLIALVLSSPFIWGMLFSFKVAKMPKRVISYSNLPMLFAWLATLSEMMILCLVFFHTWETVAIVISMAFICFILTSRKLEKSYHWFEKKLLRNIKKRGSDE